MHSTPWRRCRCLWRGPWEWWDQFYRALQVHHGPRRSSWYMGEVFCRVHMQCSMVQLYTTRNCTQTEWICWATSSQRYHYHLLSRQALNKVIILLQQQFLSTDRNKESTESIFRLLWLHSRMMSLKIELDETNQDFLLMNLRSFVSVWVLLLVLHCYQIRPSCWTLELFLELLVFFIGLTTCCSNGLECIDFMINCENLVSGLGLFLVCRHTWYLWAYNLQRTGSIDWPISRNYWRRVVSLTLDFVTFSDYVFRFTDIIRIPPVREWRSILIVILGKFFLLRFTIIQQPSPKVIRVEDKRMHRGKDKLPRETDQIDTVKQKTDYADEDIERSG